MTNVNLDAHAQWCGWKATGMNYEHAQCAMVIFSTYPDSPSAVWCWRGRAVKKLLYQSFVVVVLAILGQTASAADSSSPYMKVPATVQQKNQDLGWNGFYVGAQAGISSGYSPWTATQPGGAPNLAGSLQMFRPIDPWTEFGSHFGGLTAGYNFRLSPQMDRRRRGRCVVSKPVAGQPDVFLLRHRRGELPGHGRCLRHAARAFWI